MIRVGHVIKKEKSTIQRESRRNQTLLAKYSLLYVTVIVILAKIRASSLEVPEIHTLTHTDLNIIILFSLFSTCMPYVGYLLLAVLFCVSAITRIIFFSSEFAASPDFADMIAIRDIAH